jgi:hypothetical protein
VTVRDLLPEYVLDLLPEPGRREVEAAIGSSPVLREEVRQTASALATLSDSLSSAPVRPEQRARLFATLSSADRFREFFPILSSWFDLGEADVRAALAKIDEDSAWIDAPFPGVSYFHFQGGPASLVKEAGCLRLLGGARFPRHMHLGHERALILEGTLLLEGLQCRPGHIVEAQGGSSHDFAAAPGRKLVLVVGHDGISFSS